MKAWRVIWPAAVTVLLLLPLVVPSPAVAGTIPGGGEVTVGGPQAQVTYACDKSSITLGESFVVTVWLKNIGDTAGSDFVGSIFICFPSVTDPTYGNQVSILRETDGVMQLGAIKKAGDEITKRGGGKVPAQYLEVRADKTSWSYNEQHWFKVTVTPKIAGNVLVYIRGGFIQISTNTYVSISPTDSEGQATDHRGWSVLSKTVYVNPPVEQELQITESFRVQLNQGGSATGSIKIYNPNNEDHYIKAGSFTITDYKGFRGNIYAPNLASNLNVPAKGYATIEIKVEASLDCPKGTYYPRFAVQSDI